MKYMYLYIYIYFIYIYSQIYILFLTSRLKNIGQMYQKLKKARRKRNI